MIVFPNAKINLGLQITEKLPNGYHTINTGLYPIPWSDVLEVNKAKKTSFQATGIQIPSDGKDDLIVRAYKLLKKDYALPELKIHLHKLICIGGGLGGGSSDAAFMLRLLDQEFQLFLGDETLESYASELGSDCPFFIKNQPAYATGTGTDTEPLTLDLSGLYIRLIYPGKHLSTKQAYAGVTPEAPSFDLKKLLLSKDFDQWRTSLTNDFESSVFEQIPELTEIKSDLYDQGAVYASMTGSGSTLFGLFEEKPGVISHPKTDWTIREFIL